MRTIAEWLPVPVAVVVLIGCDNNLDSLTITHEIIPQPNTDTIVYMSQPPNAALYVTNKPYDVSFRLTGVGLANMPDWSPQKEWIVYKTNFEIWKMRYDGSRKARLTPTALMAQLPRFSLDGRYLAFIATRSNGSQHDIYLMQADGQGIEKMTSNLLVDSSGVYSFSFPSWSPDGREVLFSYARMDTSAPIGHLGFLDLRTRKLLRTIWSVDGLYPGEARWSPTRNELVTTVQVSLERGGIDLYRVDIDGQNPVRLTNDGRSWIPDWSFDGEWILYENGTRGYPSIWKMRRDGTENQELIGHGANAAW